MRRWMTTLAIGLALALGASASAEPVSGMGIAVTVDLARSELRLDDGVVLRIDGDTRIDDADLRKRIGLADIDVAEGRRELPVRYYGEKDPTGIRAVRIEIGENAFQ